MRPRSLNRRTKTRVSLVSRTFVFTIALALPWLGPACLADDADFQRVMAAAVRTAANRVLPSVVAIEIIGTSNTAQGEVEQDAPTSGVIVDIDGHVLASSIVVSSPSASLLVVLPDGTRQAARVVARDHHRDLVLLRIDSTKTLVPIDFTSPNTRAIGQTTIAVGRYGSEASPMISRGVLSAQDRLDGIALQSDARVSPALYGGPLIDLYGNVLGLLIPAIADGGAEESTSWYDSGIAFAIPGDVILRKLDQLKSGRDVKKGLIGIVAKTSDPFQDGTEVAAVRTRSPAESAGLKPGDNVLEIDGTPVRRHQEIRQALGRYDAGETIAVKVEREGNQIDLRITLAESIPPLQPQRLGVITRDETITQGEDQSTQVVVGEVLPGTPADDMLRAGDILLKVRGADLVDSDSLRRLLISAEPEQPIEVRIRRGAMEEVLSITPRSVAGQWLLNFPTAWNADAGEDVETWEVKDLKLPEAPNEAAYVAPTAESKANRLGLLILLLNPGQSSPREVLASTWADVAAKTGAVVCAIAPEDSRRWQPKEIETVVNMTAAVMKQAAISPAAVAVGTTGALAGGSGEAADTMALAVAVSQSTTFFGVAVSAMTRPPGVRLRENEAATSLQLMIPIEKSDELPAWCAAVKSAGYPIVRGGKTTTESLLQWARLLQSI